MTLQALPVPGQSSAKATSAVLISDWHSLNHPVSAVKVFVAPNLCYEKDSGALVHYLVITFTEKKNICASFITG